MAEINKEVVARQASSGAVETEGTRNRKVYSPKVDIRETADSIILAADMPGVDEKAVNITLDKNILTIMGSEEMESLKGYSLSYAEYDIGDYQRSFTISDDVDSEEIEAAIKDGVLRLTLRKAGPAKTRKISVKGG
jgi:HSP20 family molecular chaperone IbpA